MYSSSDGSLLATIDIPAYLSSRLLEDDLLSAASLSSSPSSSSFRLLQVSDDLSTAVVVTEVNTAIAVDLSHYFRLCFFHRTVFSPLYLLELV